MQGSLLRPPATQRYQVSGVRLLKQILWAHDKQLKGSNQCRIGTGRQENTSKHSFFIVMIVHKKLEDSSKKNYGVVAKTAGFSIQIIGQAGTDSAVCPTTHFPSLRREGINPPASPESASGSRWRAWGEGGHPRPTPPPSRGRT